MKLLKNQVAPLSKSLVLTSLGAICMAMGTAFILFDLAIGFAVLLFFGGVILIIDGLTKADFKDNEHYGKFSYRFFNKSLLIWLGLFIIIIFLASQRTISTNLTIMLIVLFSILFVFDSLLSVFFDVKVAKHVRDAYRNTSSDKKTVWLFVGLVVIGLILLFWWMFS